MKKIKIIASLYLLTNLTFCKAQQTYPLKTDYTEISNNSYLKDINNELNNFAGNWVSSFNGNEIKLFISKENYKYFKRGSHIFNKDVLSIRYFVKNSNGTILQDTQNMIFQNNQITHTIYSLWPENGGNTIVLYYGGTNCGIGWGEIILQKLNSTQFSWQYNPNSRVIDSATCPPNVDKNVYLPEIKDLIFTKQ
ncbi:DUF6705 family protein [Chryseobacterium sp. C3]|uniref:DUF6705 family protein n=1 Tax=Chryseobacterium sp. C3 TaxID=2761532 RepID=UPI001627DB41|nr:DUF6705 family protein [Chryseobacterium sp. C3]